MSFTKNPFKHFEFVINEQNEYVPYCHGCGGYLQPLEGEPAVLRLVQMITRHIRVDHKVKPEYFKISEASEFHEDNT